MPHLATGRLAIVAVILICLPTMPARAQDSSPWDASVHAAARLAGSMIKTASAAYLRAGVEIKLDPGWKTYWRNPGDSGIPPTLDFAGSDNVNSVTVLWPAPKRLPDGAGGNSIGYMDHVIFPLRVIPKDAATPPSVHLKFAYAICANLCMPVEANLQLLLTGDGAEEMAIEKAEMRAPRCVALGAGNDLALLSAHRQPGEAHERIVVDVTAPEGALVDLFVEGPTRDWYVRRPKQTGREATKRHFTFELDSLPPGAHADGATLTFTVVSGDDAIEVPAHLD